MTGPWRKVVADVWHERARATLVVLAMAIGLAGFLAVCRPTRSCAAN